jgi:hypothetical protein
MFWTRRQMEKVGGDGFEVAPCIRTPDLVEAAATPSTSGGSVVYPMDALAFNPVRRRAGRGDPEIKSDDIQGYFCPWSQVCEPPAAALLVLLRHHLQHHQTHFWISEDCYPMAQGEHTIIQFDRECTGGFEGAHAGFIQSDTFCWLV